MRCVSAQDVVHLLLSAYRVVTASRRRGRRNWFSIGRWFKSSRLVRGEHTVALGLDLGGTKGGLGRVEAKTREEDREGNVVLHVWQSERVE